VRAWGRRGNAGVTASDLQGAEQRLGLSLPIALREWHARFGARRDVWSVQDRLSTPSELAVDRDVLILCAEDQDVVHWGIRLDDLAAEDPPVVVSDPRGGKTWLVESPTTSAFATQLAAMNVKWSASIRCHANGQGTDEAFAAIERTYSRLPLHVTMLAVTVQRQRCTRSCIVGLHAWLCGCAWRGVGCGVRQGPGGARRACLYERRGLQGSSCAVLREFDVRRGMLRQHGLRRHGTPDLCERRRLRRLHGE